MWNQQREAFVWSQQGTRLGFPRRDNGGGEVLGGGAGFGAY